MKTKTLLFVAMLVLATGINSFSQGRGNNHNSNPSNQPGRNDQGRHGNDQDENIRPSREQVVYRRSPKVIAVRHLPNGYVAYKHHDRDYYFHEGHYYDYNNGRYIAIVPPVGLRVRILPVGFREVSVASRTYFYTGGIFYISDNNEYQIIDPPVGAIVNDLPYEAEKVRINGQTYYQYDGTIYKRIRTEMGKAYRVVGKMEG